ncbi:MAG: hypothetical protein WA057_00190 [Candidatus Magasanikiibacteriota bacterium]
MRTMLVALLSLVLFSSIAQAETYNTRLLLHGHKTVGEGFGVAGWVIAPNITSVPNKWVTLVGPCYDGQGWGVELLAGAVVSGGESKFLVDVRITFTPKFFGIPLNTWHNFQWIRTGGSGTGYWYGQVDWVLPLGLGLLGTETENTFNVSGNDWSVAPHVVISFGDHFALVFAPQAHFNARGYTGTQAWVRTVVSH